MTQRLRSYSPGTFGRERHFTPVYVLHNCQLRFKRDSLTRIGRFIKVSRTLAVTRCEIIRLATEKKKKKGERERENGSLNNPAGTLKMEILQGVLLYQKSDICTDISFLNEPSSRTITINNYVILFGQHIQVP